MLLLLDGRIRVCDERCEAWGRETVWPTHPPWLVFSFNTHNTGVESLLCKYWALGWTGPPFTNAQIRRPRQEARKCGGVFLSACSCRSPCSDWNLSSLGPMLHFQTRSSLPWSSERGRVYGKTCWWDFCGCHGSRKVKTTSPQEDYLLIVFLIFKALL